MKKFLDNYLDKCIGIILIIAVAILINKIVDKLIDRTIRRKRKKNVTTLLMFIKRIKKLILYSLMIILVLGQFEAFHKFSVTIIIWIRNWISCFRSCGSREFKRFFW